MKPGDLVLISSDVNSPGWFNVWADPPDPHEDPHLQTLRLSRMRFHTVDLGLVLEVLDDTNGYPFEMVRIMWALGLVGWIYSSTLTKVQ